MNVNVHNIKEANLSQAAFESVTFSDSNATAAELAAAFTQIKKCNALTINSYTLQEVAGSLKHIQGLTYFSIHAPYLEFIPDDFFPSTLINCFFSAGKTAKIPISLFTNRNLNKLSILSAATTLLDMEFSSLETLNLQMPNLVILPISFLPITLKRLSINQGNLQELPEELSACLELNYLHVHLPLQAEMPDLSKLFKLERLTLSGLEMASFGIKNSLPTSLQHLEIASKIPIKNVPSIAKMSKLTRLNLQGLVQLPHGLEDCPNLQQLTIQNLEEPVFPDFLACKNLSFLFIQNVGIETFPAFIFTLSLLKEIIIKKTKIKEIPNTWTKNMVLEKLDLSDNNMIISDLSFISNFPKLKSLDLNGNTLANPYALIFSKKIPLTNQYDFLKNIRYTKGGHRNRRGKKEPGFLEFCAALSRAKLSVADKKWFFDLFSRMNNISQLPALDFPQFLKGLNINFAPLRTVLERKLIRDVVLQHLSDAAIFQTSKLFEKSPSLKKGDCLFLAGKMILSKSAIKETAEGLGLSVKYRLSDEVTHVVLGQEAEDWKNEPLATNFQIITESALRVYFTKNAPKYLQADEQSGDQSMVKNILNLLENPDTQNIQLGLELMEGGGVPKAALEHLLILAKTATIPEIRKKSRALLEPHAPPKWLPLLKNRLGFYQENLWMSTENLCKQFLKLGEQIEPDLTAFFIVLIQGQLDIYPEMRDALDEPLYQISKKMKIDEKILQPDAVVFINGTTRLKKTEIKEKLETANLKYTSKYSSAVTHVLIGNNPKKWDLDSANFKILTENHLQTYLSQTTPAYLEQAADEGDSQMTENLLKMLHSPDEMNLAIALEMLEGGGVPADLIVPVLVVSKSATDAKIRAKARKLLELYAPTDWLPLIKNKLLFKGITANAKENDLNKKLDKLAKETSFEVAAILSMGLFRKYGRGLRFMMKKSNRKNYLEAVQLLLDGTHLAFAKGLGFKNWRNHAPEAVILMGAMKTGINFPDSILELGKIESIDFHNCKLKAMPKSITKFVDVKALDFSHNFIGTLPLGIAKLKNLEILDLKMNQFEEFPTRISTLKNLKKVDLRFNRINHEFTKLAIPQAVIDALPNCEILI